MDLLKDVGGEPSAAQTTLDADLKEAARAFNWEKAEKLAGQLQEEADRGIEATLGRRVAELRGRAERLTEATGALPEELAALPEKVGQAVGDHAFPTAVELLGTWTKGLQKVEAGQSEALKERLRAVLLWGGAGPKRAELEGKFTPCFDKLDKGEVKEARACLEERLPTVFPEASGRLRTLVEEGRGLLKLAGELGLDASALSRALDEAPKATPLAVDRVGEGILAARHELENGLRHRSEQRIQELVGFIETLKEEGADLAEGVGTLQEVRLQIASAPVEDLRSLVGRADAAVEGPAMSVVAAYIDEVRPRLVEARQLGRNAAPAIEEVNRAREAYRSKDFPGAVRAAQKALEIISELVADLEAAHDEVSEFKQLLARLNAGGLTSSTFEQFLREAEAALRRNDPEKMRSALQEGLRIVGRESLPFFRGQLDAQKRILGRLEDHGWGTPELPERLREVRHVFQDGRFAETAEALAAFKTSLRAAVAPHLSHRLEELGKAVEEIPDTEAVAGVRRLMAETDIAFKVKEDMEQALENLARTEKELAVTFAARASSLVEELEDERKGLAGMGIETSTLEREIAQIHQIFDLGDFLKASRASRELKARILQQQLLRAEEEVSKAKFALVELAKMGLEPSDLRSGLVDASDRVRSGRYPGAYQRASQVRKDAQEIKATAQKVREEIGALAETVSGLRKAGVGAEELQPVLPKAKQASEAYQRMEFDRALSLTAELAASLRSLSERREATRSAVELDGLVTGAKLVGAGDPTWEKELKQAQADLSAGNVAAATTTLKQLRPTIVEGVRGALDKQLRALEGDLRSARGAGLDTLPVESSLTEARRRLADPLPLGVAELIDRSRREFFQGRSFLEQAQKAVALAREAVNKGELVRANTTELKVRLEEVERRFAAGDLPTTLELAQRLTQEAEEGVRRQVTKTLASFQAMINHAKMEGANTAVAENLLVQARNLLAAGKALEALSLATKSETELERVELQHSLATNALLTLKGRVDDAKEQGIRAPEAEREVARAEDMIARGDYAGVLERTMEGGDLLLRAADQRRRAADTLEGTDRLLGSLTGMGADLAGPKGDLARARAKFDGGEYASAQSLARDASEAARGAAEGILEERRNQVRGLLETARTKDPEHVAQHEERLGRAEAALKAHDWKNALDLFQEAQGPLAQALQKSLGSDEEKVRALWKSIPAADEAESRARTTMATEMQVARERGDVSRYRMLVERALEESQGLRRRHQEGEIAELESRVLLGERLGVDMTPVMETLSEIKMNARAGPMEALQGQLAKAEEALSKLISTRLTDRTTELAGETAFARDGLGMEVGAVETLLQGVELLQAGGDIIGAARRLVEAEGELARRKELHWQLTNTQYMIDQKLATLAERKVDLTAVKELVAEAGRARQTDYARALEISQKALDEIRRLLNDGTPAAARGGGGAPAPATAAANPGHSGS